MLSILVCHSYFLRFDPKQVERGKPYPPLATLQVAALLRRAGHQVALFDAMLADGVAEYERKLAATQPDLVLFYEDNFNFLSKMCLGKMRSAGINDLRLGNVVCAPSDSRGTQSGAQVSLPDGIRCFTIAGSLAAPAGNPDGRLPDDGFVPVASALGRHPEPDRRLDFAPCHQVVVSGTGHLDLLSSAEVYALVHRWLS